MSLIPGIDFDVGLGLGTQHGRVEKQYRTPGGPFKLRLSGVKVVRRTAWIHSPKLRRTRSSIAANPLPCSTPLKQRTLEWATIQPW